MVQREGRMHLHSPGRGEGRQLRKSSILSRWRLRPSSVSPTSPVLETATIRDAAKSVIEGRRAEIPALLGTEHAAPEEAVHAMDPGIGRGT